MKPNWLKNFVAELSDKWQIPVLILAVIVAGPAIYKLLSHQRDLTTEQYIQKCEELVAKGEYVKAAKLSSALLEDPKIAAEPRSHLHGILARALHKIEAGKEKHDPRTSAQIHKHLKASVHDRPFTAEEHLIWAEADRRLGNFRSSVQHMQQALEAGHTDRPAILKQIAEVLPRTGDGYESEYARALDEVLSEPGLTSAELAWAASRKSELLYAEGRFAEAVELIRSILPRVSNEQERLELEYALAFGEYSRGHLDPAEQALRNLVDRIVERGELDAKATLLLGRICLKDDRPEEALAFFNTVISRHANSEYQVSAVLGRAEGLAKLRRVNASQLAYEKALELLDRVGPNAIINRKEIFQSIKRVTNEYVQRDQLEWALGFAHLHSRFLEDGDDPEKNVIWARIGTWADKLSKQLSKKLEKVGSTQMAAELKDQIRSLCLDAGEHFLKLADGRGLSDRESADALWQAALCYRRAPMPEKMIELLERLVNDWPNDPHLPEALYRLARGYQDMGRFGEAVKYYHKLISEYRRTPWGLRAPVLMARCYMTMGPDHYDRADKILTEVVDDTSNRRLYEPESMEFRRALFLLGRLYYYQGKYEECAARLEEALQRYPQDRACPEAMFLIGQSYRKLAEEYHRKINQTNDGDLKLRFARNKQHNLRQSAHFYASARDAFEVLADKSGLEKAYLQLAYIYYADCLYDLGEYAQSVEEYGRVVDRSGNSQIALAAYLQIINSYQRLGRWGKIKAVLERMKWLVQQLPDSAFTGPSAMFSRRDWQEWIKWNYRSGLLSNRKDVSLVRGSGQSTQF